MRPGGIKRRILNSPNGGVDLEGLDTARLGSDLTNFFFHWVLDSQEWARAGWLMLAFQGSHPPQQTATCYVL